MIIMYSTWHISLISIFTTFKNYLYSLNACNKKMQTVGLEPTRANTLRPERSTLDHSVTFACKIIGILVYFKLSFHHCLTYIIIDILLKTNSCLSDWKQYVPLKSKEYHDSYLTNKTHRV